MNGKEIAETILNQLGNKMMVMVGAYTISYSKDGALTFKFKGSKIANCLKIGLDVDDTYILTFIKIWGTNVKVVKKVDGVYFDMMHEIFETTTGLYTSL